MEFILMKKSKILIIGEAFFPEDFIINDLAQEWSKKGVHVEVLTRTPSYPFGIPYEGYKNKIYQKTFFERILIHRIPILKGYQKNKYIKVFNYFTFILFSSIVALRIGNRFDEVFVYQTGPLTVALPGILIKKIYNKRLTIWTQDLWPDTVYAYGFKKNFILKNFLDRLVSFVYNNANTILVSCKGFESTIVSYLKVKKKIRWVPNWPIITDLGITKEKLPGEINFTFAGNIGKVQNLDKVILGFKNVSNVYPGAWLNLIGDGSTLQGLKELVDSKGIKNVNFTGRKPLNQMPDYFRASDVLLLSLVNTPIYEIMIPSKFQTYLLFEKPIYAIMKGEVPSLVKSNHIGISADPDDLYMIEQGFIKFIQMSKEGRRELGTSSKKLLESSFDREKNIELITNVVFGLERSGMKKEYSLKEN